jgi:hypothetical protein
MKSISIIGIYSIFFSSLVFILNSYIFPGFLSEEHFLNWDAQHYFSIKNGNYSDFRTAFFPFFPLVWKITGFSILGITLFNSLIYLFSFYWLTKVFHFTSLQILLFLTIPCAIFYYLPYTEAFFFLFSSLIIVGLKKKNYTLIYLGLFLCVVTRPSFTVLAPALFITFWLTLDSLKERIKHCFSASIVVSLGILSVLAVQYFYNHSAENYFSIQKGWGNFLQLPHLPLTSWAGGFIVRLDGVAFLFAVLSGLLLLVTFMRKKKQKHPLSPEFVFSALYIVGIGLLVLLFRGGSLFSLNRFVFATPFVLIVLYYWLEYKINLTSKQILLIGIGIFLFWLLFGSYVHIQVLLKFLLLTLYMVLLFIIKHHNQSIQRYWLIGLIAINGIFQLLLFVRFLSNSWVG